MALPDFGVDLKCGASTAGDLDPTCREVTGVELVSDAAFRRLDTSRGQLIDDATYGDALRDHLGQEVVQADIDALGPFAVAELNKDETIGVVTTSTAIAADGSISVEVHGETALGPFSFTFPVDKADLSSIGGAGL